MSLNLLEADRLGELCRYYVQEVEWGEKRYVLVLYGRYFVLNGMPRGDIIGSGLMTDEWWSCLSTTEEGAWEHLPDDLKAARAKA